MRANKMRGAAGPMVLALLLFGCGDEPTTAELPHATPSPPDLSAPQRFRPSIVDVTVTPAVVKTGEVAVLTARVSSVVPGSTVEWVVAVDDASTGNGILSTHSGTGPLRAEFAPNHPGEVAFFLHAEDARGVPARAVRVLLTVAR